MLVVLPPSESKSVGGVGPPLDRSTLGFPDFDAIRERVARTLVRTSEHPERGAAALGLSPAQGEELRRNTELLRAATCPAVERYTGVLYDALDVQTLDAAARARADQGLVICSALFGLVRASDLIPAYRLSASAKLPRIASLPALWKPKLLRVLQRAAREQLIVDLRSGAYRAFGSLSDAVTVRVLTDRPDGTRSVVSHFNKASKGRVARLLVQHEQACQSVDDVIDVLRRGGFVVEHAGAAAVDVVVPAS